MRMILGEFRFKYMYRPLEQLACLIKPSKGLAQDAEIVGCQRGIGMVQAKNFFLDLEARWNNFSASS